MCYQAETIKNPRAGQATNDPRPILMWTQQTNGFTIPPFTRTDTLPLLPPKDVTFLSGTSANRLCSALQRCILRHRYATTTETMPNRHRHKAHIPLLERPYIEEGASHSEEPQQTQHIPRRRRIGAHLWVHHTMSTANITTHVLPG